MLCFNYLENWIIKKIGCTITFVATAETAAVLIAVI